ncbi:MAG: hypothetical protein LBU22_05780 [Dysgonamonadaceae bacterium]|jgi:hypothetical protein|nr:hypothetical protein [Dysgonamonadaceae bacterium]
MKKKILFVQLALSFFILFFSSCIEHDYDLTDDKLDKNVVISPDGANVPIGDLERISIFEELKKQYNDIKDDDDDILYIEYSGNFEGLDLPSYDIFHVEQQSTKKISVNFPKVINIPAPINNQALLLNPEAIAYKLPVPEFDENWSFKPEEIKFDNFMVKARFQLSGVNYVSGDAKLILEFDFPTEYFTVKGGNNGKIRREVVLSKTNDMNYVLSEIAIESYRYPKAGAEAHIAFQLYLDVANSFSGTANQPTFQLFFESDNNGNLINSVRGAVSGKKSFTGAIKNIDGLNSSFSGNKLEFGNPSLCLTLHTNLGADSKLDIDKIDAHNGTDPLSLKGVLDFAKPTTIGAVKATSYYLAPYLSTHPGDLPSGSKGEILAIDNLFKSGNGSIPKKIDYAFTLNVHDEQAVISARGMTMEGNYVFKLPLLFDNLSLAIDAPPISLGNEYLHKMLFQYQKEKIALKADIVNVVIGTDTQQNTELNIIAEVELLDAKEQVINVSGVKTPVVNLHNGENKDFSIDIVKDYLDKAENATYLRFRFTLAGGNIALTKNDYIDIRGLRVVTDGGIHFEL